MCMMQTPTPVLSTISVIFWSLNPETSLIRFAPASIATFATSERRVSIDIAIFG